MEIHAGLLLVARRSKRAKPCVGRSSHAGNAGQAHLGASGLPSECLGNTFQLRLSEFQMGPLQEWLLDIHSPYNSK